LCFSQVKAKYNDDLLIGTEHSKKIIPECTTPNNLYEELTQEDKVKVVLQDPKFGMFALFRWQLTNGYKNEILKQKNAFYCAHIFSLLTFLPIIVFFIQWSILIALISEQIKSYDKGFCPNESGWEVKLIMFSVCMLYFVRSFFLWDNLTDRTRLNRMTPSINFWVMLDTFQEFGFNLIIYLTNLWIVYSNDSLQEMILNSLAMEFLMNLDNDFESVYFEYLPEAAEDIYDNSFVTFKENEKELEKANKSCYFRCARNTFYIPFKLLVTALLLFPPFCIVMSIYGSICK
tara:strand:+ start:576 stop:1442 length:867 start_codon:yes stop_codon:yes gene_type:complete